MNVPTPIPDTPDRPTAPVEYEEPSAPSTSCRQAAVYRGLAWASFVLAAVQIVWHLHFVLLPAAFFFLGFVAYLASSRRGLQLFLFLLPLINSLPDLFWNGYPFNYMALTLFFLAGLALASSWRRENLEFVFPGSRVYLLWLVLLWISALFVFLRWSNLGHSPLAFFRDTPVSPGGERLSFASIFPVITLFIFSFAPHIAALLRRNRFSWRQAAYPLMAGLSGSVILALIQKNIAPDLLCQKWWIERLNRANGGFSDFNALGLFAGLIFLWQVLSMGYREKTPSWPQRILLAAFMLSSLAGIYLSGTRSAFLFVLAAFVFLLLRRRKNRRFMILIVVLLVILFLAVGGNLRDRVFDSVGRVLALPAKGSSFQALDDIANGRLMMIKNSLPMFLGYPLTGVGVGNFLFFLKYSKFGGGWYYEDLPLNQYLLFLDETGFVGLAIFLVFLGILFHGLAKEKRFLLLILSLALFFNFFFWFAECLLLFFILFTDFGEAEAVAKGHPARWSRIISLALFALFTLAHLRTFRSLDPVTWAREKNVAYDYGFWYEERGVQGEFNWSRAAAGRYVFPGKPARIRLFCDAPLRLLRQGKQTVRLFWRGKLQKVVVFRENRAFDWIFPPGASGFFEIRVAPTFNLMKMGYGPETRDLGIQVFFDPPR